MKKIGQSEAIVEYGGEGFSPDAVAFSLKTLDGQQHQFGMKVEDVPYFVAGLITLARQSTELAGPLKAPEPGDALPQTRSLVTTGVTASSGTDGSEPTLVVHTGGFPMKFATTPEAMLDLVADLERLGMARRS